MKHVGLALFNEQPKTLKKFDTEAECTNAFNLMSTLGIDLSKWSKHEFKTEKEWEEFQANINRKHGEDKEDELSFTLANEASKGPTLGFSAQFLGVAQLSEMPMIHFLLQCASPETT